jgi:integrase
MSFIVHKTTGTNWIIKKVTYKNGKSERRAISELAYAALGFNRETMTVEHAKERAARLNLERKAENEMQKKMVKAAEVLAESKKADSIYLPRAFVKSFEEYLDSNYIKRQKFGDKMLFHWQKAQEVIIALKLLPRDYSTNKNSIVSRFAKLKLSLDYSKKIMRVISLWGEFYSEKQGQFYRPIPKMDNVDIQLITDAYTESDGFRGESEHITPEDLASLKNHLSEEHYRWVYVSVWCGLRPSEVNALKSKVNGYRIERSGKTDVLCVYQGKLIRVAKAKRWKRIPLFLPEHKLIVPFIEAGLKQPLVKTLKKYTEKKVGLYGGRKAFTDLMMDRGQSLEDVSQWLGHTSIERTWRTYKDKKIVRFTEV